MTKLTPEGRAVLDELRRLRRKKDRQQKAVDQTRAEMKALVKASYGKVGMSRMAAVIGVSAGRVCQWKDEDD